MSNIFTTVLYQPIFNLFVGLYHIVPDIGVVIFLLTLLLKAVLYPLTSASIKAQKSLTDLQPKLEAIKKEQAGNKQRIAEETMKLYKEHKVNPMGSCLPLLIQLPIFIALYWVLQAGLTDAKFDLLYSFVPNPGKINTFTLHLIDLSKTNIVLAVLAGAAQFWQAKMLTRKRPPVVAGSGAKDEDMAAMMNKQMLYMMPVITVLVGLKLPAGLALYWLLSTVLTALQQLVVFKKPTIKHIA